MKVKNHLKITPLERLFSVCKEGIAMGEREIEEMKMCHDICQKAKRSYFTLFAGQSLGRQGGGVMGEKETSRRPQVYIVWFGQCEGKRDAK